MIKFYPKLKVGTEEYKPLSKKDSPLSFMSWYESEKVKGNLDSLKWWCSHKDTEEVIHTFDNEPIEGFKLVGMVTRWETSNRWFEVTDPRGFKLQISAQNICNIVKDAEIKKGAIIGKCIWGRSGNYNYLIPVESDDYKQAVKDTEDFKKEKIKPKDLVIGRTYITPSGKTERVYLGRYKIEGKNNYLFAHYYQYINKFSDISFCSSYAYNSWKDEDIDMVEAAKNKVISLDTTIKNSKPFLSGGGILYEIDNAALLRDKKYITAFLNSKEK